MAAPGTRNVDRRLTSRPWARYGDAPLTPVAVIAFGNPQNPDDAVGWYVLDDLRRRELGSVDFYSFVEPA
ncbi:MAG: hypothetical protein H5T84_10485, partial [Thermoleophilia bacterium]|nr:hypothetical protein [Thermoleophilia bacterium]